MRFRWGPWVSAGQETSRERRTVHDGYNARHRKGDLQNLAGLAGQLQKVRERIKNAALRAGRDPTEITLVAVTKGVDVPRIEAALELGIQHIGENRVQEAEAKLPQLGRSCQRHLIGTLQRNKVPKALELFDLLHSVDRVALVERIARRAEADGREMVDVCLQVNVSGEKSKHGVTPEELEPLAKAASQSGNVRVVGLMTMAPYADDPELARPTFVKLRELGERLGGFGFPNVSCDVLSMGMSGDFEVAIAEGATHVRIGSAIFS